MTNEITQNSTAKTKPQTSTTKNSQQRRVQHPRENLAAVKVVTDSFLSKS